MAKGVGGAANHPSKISNQRRIELDRLVCKDCIFQYRNHPRQKEQLQMTHSGTAFQLNTVTVVDFKRGEYTYCKHMPKIDCRRVVPCSHYCGNLSGFAWKKVRHLMATNNRYYESHKHMLVQNVMDEKETLNYEKETLNYEREDVNYERHED